MKLIKGRPLGPALGCRVFSLLRRSKQLSNPLVRRRWCGKVQPRVDEFAIQFGRIDILNQFQNRRWGSFRRPKEAGIRPLALCHFYAVIEAPHVEIEAVQVIRTWVNEGIEIELIQHVASFHARKVKFAADADKAVHHAVVSTKISGLCSKRVGLRT